MRYKLLGRSGLRVSELALGTMTFGEDWGWGSSADESRRVFERYAEAGGNFIDTANLYTNGSSEKLVGEFIRADRDHFVVATKYTLSQRHDDPNQSGNHRKSMVHAIEASLQRLGTDYIDLYWVHAWDPMTPLEEMMRALDDLVRAGKVLYVGISDTPAWVVARANTLADWRGWSRFVGLQIQYSLIERTPERELLPMARALDLTVTPWAVLGAGLLSGKFSGGKQVEGARLSQREDSRFTERNLAIADTVVEVARGMDRSPSQVAIAWLRQRGDAQLVPILGARTLAQLEDNLGCLNLELDADPLARLDQASSIELGFPHDFLSQPGIKRIRYGDSFERIDDHRRG